MKPLVPPGVYLEHPERVEVVDLEDTDPDIGMPDDETTQVTKLRRSLGETIAEAEQAAQQGEAKAEQAARILQREGTYSNLKKNLSTPPPGKK